MAKTYQAYANKFTSSGSMKSSGIPGEMEVMYCQESSFIVDLRDMIFDCY